MTKGIRLLNILKVFFHFEANPNQSAGKLNEKKNTYEEVVRKFKDIKRISIVL